MFKRIIENVKRKQHFSLKRIQEIINLKASLNLGISNELKTLFTNTIAVTRPKVNNMEIPNPYWLSGFAEGEACFFISIYKSFMSRLGLSIQLVFKITQHSRDIELLETIARFFYCGRVKKRNIKACGFTVNYFKDIESKFVPFFLQCPLHGIKFLNYNDFKEVVKLWNVKVIWPNKVWKR